MRLTKPLLGFILASWSISTFAVSMMGDIPKPPAGSAPALYVEIAGGYAFRNWSGTFLSPYNNYFVAVARDYSNIQTYWYSHITAGLDVGYCITKSLAVELGGYYLPRVSGELNSNSAITNRVNTWFLYLAGKLQTKLVGSSKMHLDVFTKVGPVFIRATPKGTMGYIFNNSNNTFSPFGYSSSNNFSVFFSAGASYTIKPPMVLSLQYVFVPGNVFFNWSGPASEIVTPNNNLIVLSFAYLFSL